MSGCKSFVLALCASACATDHSPCPSIPGTSTPGTAAEAKRVLGASCAVGGCHLGAGTAGLALDMTTDAWRAALVDVPAREAPGLDLVTPGDPDRSWMLHKVFGSFCDVTCASSLGCGGVMPFGKSLSESDLDALAAWVRDGAPAS